MGANRRRTSKTGRSLFLLMAAISLISQVAFAQMEPFLLLEKPGTKKRIRYYAGDDIIFKLRDQDQIFEAVLVGFSDTAFFVGNWTPIALRNVEAIIDRSKVKAVRGISIKALGTIPLFFVFSTANNYFNTGRRPLIDPEIWTLSGIFAGIGIPGLLYKGRRHRLDNRWRIIVVKH